MSHPALPASILVLLLTSTAQAEQVEITLADRLDGDLSRYCLDIVGSQSRAETEKGLQAHTCYSYQGNLGVDQVFETDRFADGVLYMPEFDVCATVSGLEVGATLGLATCDGSSLQNITLTEPGKLSPADAPTLCFTAGKDTRPWPWRHVAPPD